MSNCNFIIFIYTFAIFCLIMICVLGIFMILGLLFRLVLNSGCLPACFFTMDEELPFEPKEERLSFKDTLAQTSKTIFKNILFSIVMIMTLMACCDFFLYIENDPTSNFEWLPTEIVARLDSVYINPDEVKSCFSAFHILVGLAFIIEPLCEIAFFKYKVSQLRPSGRMMTGIECYHVTKEIDKLFYSPQFAIMSKPRKLLRKAIFCFGIFMSLSWLIMHVFKTS